MADKLSERLDDAWRKLYADGDEHDVCDTIAEAAELARRVDGAPVADIREDGKNGGESALLSAATRAGYYQGQRVRIVPEQGEG